MNTPQNIQMDNITPLLQGRYSLLPQQIKDVLKDKIFQIQLRDLTVNYHFIEVEQQRTLRNELLLLLFLYTEYTEIKPLLSRELQIAEALASNIINDFLEILPSDVSTFILKGNNVSAETKTPIQMPSVDETEKVSMPGNPDVATLLHTHESVSPTVHGYNRFRQINPIVEKTGEQTHRSSQDTLLEKEKLAPLPTYTGGKQKES